MSKKVVTANTEVAAVNMDAFGNGGVSSADVVIPKILAMQGLSKMVTEGVAKFGDLVDSLSGEVLGNTDKPVQVIPFHLHKIWITSFKAKGKNKFEFQSIEDVTPANENKSWEVNTAEGTIKNEKCFNFYCLRPDDMSLPYIVGFKSTSLKAGKQLATQMYVKNRSAGKVPPAKVINLGGIKRSNDDGTFVVLDVNVARDSSNEEIMECLNWFKTVQSGGTKTDNSDIGTKPTNTTADTNPEF